MIIDVHCHCTYTRRPAHSRGRFSFEPAEIDGQAALDSCIAPRCLRRLTWRLTNRLLGFAPHLGPGVELDRILAEFYETHHFGEGPVERIVLLAFDAYHDDDGRRPAWLETRKQVGSDIYTSNSFVYDVCRQHPERFLFGASVHPYRENAVACVEEVWWLPERHRLRAELLLLTPGDETEAEALFRQALQTARGQGSRSLELRAATSLAHLLQEQGRIAEGQAMLGEVYDWFTEGFDTFDLLEARELLEELAERQEHTVGVPVLEC